MITASRLRRCFEKPVPCDAETGQINSAASPEKPKYFPFREQILRINVRPVVVQPVGQSIVQPAATAPKIASTHGPFYSMVKNLSEKMTPDEVWWHFTRGQLECYKGDNHEDTNKTIRIEGEKLDDAGQIINNVHLYELFWSDLSTRKAGIFSIFTELYQLLFHLSSLGVHTITAATAVNGGSVWQTRLRLQTWASSILTVTILILNLIMVGIAASGLGLSLLSDLTPRLQFLLVAAVPVAGKLIGCGRTSSGTGATSPLWKWLLPWPPALVIGAVLYNLSSALPAGSAAGLSKRRKASFSQASPVCSAWLTPARRDDKRRPRRPL